jgi:hypothetical protein
MVLLAPLLLIRLAGGQNVIVCSTDGFGVRLMRYGQTVQIFDSTLATNNRGSATITTWDVENKTVNLNSSDCWCYGW